MDYDTAKKDMELGAELQKKRREFQKLQDDEEKYLTDREVKAQARIEDLGNTAEGASVLAEEKVGMLGTIITRYKKKFSSFYQGLVSTLDLADTLIDKITSSIAKLDTTAEDLQKHIEKFDDLIAENTELKKRLTQKQKEADNKIEKADNKLKKALEIADWAKRDAYTITDHDRKT